MPERDQQRLDIAEELLLQIAPEDTLTPIQARSFVRGLQTAWDVPPIQWGEDDSRIQLNDARRLIDAAAIFRKVEGASSANAIQCYRRAGELLEWLTRAQDETDTFIPLELLAAASYQLGGLPAMASALLTQTTQRTRGKRLYAQFLRADFDAVIRTTTAFWRLHLEITDRKAPVRLLEEDGDDKISWYFTVELVRVLGAISDALRSGTDDRLERSLAKLRALDRMALRTMGEDASILVALLYEVAKSFQDASIYGPIRALGALNPDRMSRLERFARTQFSRKRGILWTSQRHGIQRLLEESSFALCTPTGSGKTLVANLALVKELLLADNDLLGPLALYLVPSRALASEVEAKLSSELGRDFIVTGLYGGADWGITDYWLGADRPTVLVATVEKADALMRYLGPLLLARLKLLIVDEAHQVVPEDDERAQADFAEHSSRSIRLEGFVSRLLTLAPEIVRIALTAVAGGAAPPIARWIEGREEAEAVGTRYRSTRQIIGVLETNPGSAGRMLLELINGRALYVRGRDDPVYLRLRTPPMPQLSAKMRDSLYRFNELDVLWTALHLVDDERRILISVAQQPEKTMGWYKEALQLPSWQETFGFEPPEDDLARFEEARAACIDYCGEDSYELALLDQGIATNHGQMPQRLRRLMTDLIDRGICPITVATATLTEGVNLPFDIIFVTSLKRSTYDTVNNQPIESPMSTSEFRNLSGRAGRPGASNGMEGITLVAIPRRISTTARTKIPTQRRQLRTLRADYEALRQRLLEEEHEQVEVDSPLALLLHSIADRARTLLGVQGDDFLNWLEGVLPTEISDAAGTADTSADSRLADSVDELDGILLNAINEIEAMQVDGLDGAEAEQFLANLWRRTFSAYAAVQEEWLERAFVRRGRAVIDEIYPDAAERERLYQYGYTPLVGQRFDPIAPAMNAIMADAQGYGGEEPAQRFAKFVQLGEIVAADRGYGFRIRDTNTDRAILDNWQGVLAWWLHLPDAERPDPSQLRSWQRFIADNIDFRFSVAIGAAVARAWSEGTDGEFEIPSLDAWNETTGLPWFGFWARELLRWGTLDPFVAFSLAQGLAHTRDEAAARRPEFEAWLTEERDDIDPEDLIDPQLFLTWQRSLPEPERAAAEGNRVSAVLSGTTGERGRYRVVPVVADQTIHWIDPAGYLLARSSADEAPFGRRLFFQDFELHTNEGEPFVERQFG